MADHSLYPSAPFLEPSYTHPHIATQGMHSTTRQRAERCSRNKSKACPLMEAGARASAAGLRKRTVQPQ